MEEIKPNATEKSDFRFSDKSMLKTNQCSNYQDSNAGEGFTKKRSSLVFLPIETLVKNFNR